MINKLTLSALVTTPLLLAAGTSRADTADLALDPDRMFFAFFAPSGDSGDFQVLPGNRYNPIVLPCVVERFGGQLDIHDNGQGGDVSPGLVVTMALDGSPIFVGGNPLQSAARGGFGQMSAGTVQVDGYTAVNSARPWLFQPEDLPENKVVVMHVAVLPHLNDGFSGPLVTDSNPGDNGRDIFVRRACAYP
jgi:hypothetical protein